MIKDAWLAQAPGQLVKDLYMNVMREVTGE